MRGPLTVKHWSRGVGFIKPNMPVCGIAEKVDGWVSVNFESLKHEVTCEHCLHWLWEQEQPAKKMDLTKALGDAAEAWRPPVRNSSLSAHDAEKAIALGIEQGLAKVSTDFQEAKPDLARLVADGVEAALQRGSVRQNLVGVHKIAEDEIDDEWDKDNPDFEEEAEEKRRAEIRAEVHNALDERAVPNVKQQVQDALYELFDQEGFKRRMRRAAKEGAAQALTEQEGAGVGTTVEFTQNVYSPETLSPEQIYRQAFHGENPSTTVVNVNAEVDPESFKDMVKEAAREYDEETLEQYDEEETALMQKAVASVVASDQFQDLFKKLVKDAVEEKALEDHRRQMDLHYAWFERRISPISRVMSDPGDAIEGSDHNAQKIGIELYDVNEPRQRKVLRVVHYKPLYKSVACGKDATYQDTSWTKTKVTCMDCRRSPNF